MLKAHKNSINFSGMGLTSKSTASDTQNITSLENRTLSPLDRSFSPDFLSQSQELFSHDELLSFMAEGNCGQSWNRDYQGFCRSDGFASNKSKFSSTQWATRWDASAEHKYP